MVLWIIYVHFLLAKLKDLATLAVQNSSALVFIQDIKGSKRNPLIIPSPTYLDIPVYKYLRDYKETQNKVNALLLMTILTRLYVNVLFNHITLI